MQKPLESTTANGWRIQLLSPNGWTNMSEHPMHKTRAKNAARTWRKDFKIRARIVKVRIVTETFAQEEI